MNKSIIALVTSLLFCNGLMAKTLVLDDSFADGGRSKGSDKKDSDWWTSSSANAIEVSVGSLGLVSGGAGRGIRTTFDPQKLMLGDSIRATFTFTTPATIGTDRDSGFRIGLYDAPNRKSLEADLSATSSTPNPLYDGVQGYMIDFDVNLSDLSKTNIDIRKKSSTKSGRLLGSTKNYERIAGGGSPYRFIPKVTYTGVITLTYVSDGVYIGGSLFEKGKQLSRFSALSKGSTVNNIGMLAFHVSSETFGSSKELGVPDNGLDFKNVKVEVLP